MPYTDEKIVRQIIQESFEDTIYPGDDKLVGHDPRYSILPIYKKLLRGKSWKELLHKLENMKVRPLLSYQLIFVYISDEAYCYYAPAFLIRCLEPGTDMFGNNLLFTLNPIHYQDDSEARFARRMQLFSDRQKHAIAVAVDYMVSPYMEEERKLGDLEYVQLWEYWSQWLAA